MVIARTNERSDELIYLARQAFTPASVYAEPLIHQGRTISEKDIREGSDKEKETCGEVMIQGLWY